MPDDAGSVLRVFKIILTRDKMLFNLIFIFMVTNSENLTSISQFFSSVKRPPDISNLNLLNAATVRKLST